MAAPIPKRSNDPQALEKILQELLPERPSSAGSRNAGSYSPTSRTSRPSSILGGSKLGLEHGDRESGSPSRTLHVQSVSTATQTLSTAPITTIYEYAPTPTIEKLTYNKGIQTSDSWTSPQKNRSIDRFSDSDSDKSPSAARSPKASKRSNRREREKEEELRQNLRREIEEELKAIKDPVPDGPIPATPAKFPARALNDEELNAVTSSEDFLDFVERSSKVIERTLDQEYDVLANYALDGLEGIENDEDEGYGSSRGKKGRRIREVTQFYDERWSKKRLISDLSFSPKVVLIVTS